MLSYLGLKNKGATLVFVKIKDGTLHDTIQAIKKQLDSDSDVNCTTVQFHDNNHNS
jgi:hypothetical protein